MNVLNISGGVWRGTGGMGHMSGQAHRNHIRRL